MPTPRKKKPPSAKPITVDELWAMARVGNVAASPDGTRAVCTVTHHSMETNKASTQLWLMFADGRAPQQLTHSGDKNTQPAWSPPRQGQPGCIAFIGKREQENAKDDTGQLYMLNASGGEARRISQFAPGIEAFKWLPDGQHIVFVAWVWPELKGAAAQAKRYKTFSEQKESGYATSEAQWRYFDHNLPQGRVLHLLTLDVSTGRVTDLFEGTDHELPRDDPSSVVFDIHPDGKRLVFACDTGSPKVSSHRLSLMELTLKTRRFKNQFRNRFKNISDVRNWGQWDFNAPRYSPDGRSLAAVAAHSHQQHTTLAQLLLLGPDGQWRDMGHNRDHEVNAPLRWSADGSGIYLTAEEFGRCHLWRYELASKRWPVQFKGGWVQAFDVGGGVGVESGAEHVFTVADGASHPARVHVQQGAGEAKRIDKFNDDILQRCDLGPVQEQQITGALGDKVQVWLTYPPGFNAKKKYPVMHVIHGGPYAASGETFSYRWNSHVLASQGHVVVQVNYHGSSSFGFQFRNSIIGRLGQLETLDIEATTDWLLHQPWVDAGRIVATGGSYGGYLVAWMNGHVAPGRYQAYVCHAGVFDRVATWSADSYTHRPKDLGANYWDDLKKVLAQSPHAFAGKMQTPTLVIHGAQDFRVPDTNGLAYYNTLKARGVDARFLWFPDENHWVLKARNSKQWYGEFLTWVGHYTSPRSAVHPGVAA